MPSAQAPTRAARPQLAKMSFLLHKPQHYGLFEIWIIKISYSLCQKMGLITERQTARLNLTIYIRCIYYYQPKNDERKVSEANLSRVFIKVIKVS